MLGWLDEDLKQYAFCQGVCEAFANDRGANRRLLVYCASLGALTRGYVRNPRLKPLDEREQVDLLGRLRARTLSGLQERGIADRQAPTLCRDIETAIAAFACVAKPKSYGLHIAERPGSYPDQIECIRTRDNFGESYKAFVAEARQRVFAGPPRRSVFSILRR